MVLEKALTFLSQKRPSMNIPYCKLTLLGLVFFILSTSSFALPIHWLPPDLASVQAQAQREDKLFLLYFTADWCAPCQWMQENTFQDTELNEHLRENILTVKVDLNHAQAKELQHRFEVEAIPTILVFATNGQLIDRQATTIEAKHLLRWLKRVDKPAHHVNATLPEPTTATAMDAPQPQLAFSRPALIPEAEQEHLLSEYQHRPASPGLVLTGAPLASNDAGFTPRSSLHYGVQLKAAPVSYTTAVQMIQELERKFEQPVEMDPVTPGAFRLILGTFDTTGEARQFLQFLQRNDREGEVVPLNK
jgi:thioredoxin-related protein